MSAGPSWFVLPGHHQWLAGESDRLLALHERDVDFEAVGFAPLDARGHRDAQAERELYATARLVHCFSLAHLMGRPGANAISEHGMRALLGPFRDAEHGGWFASVSREGDAVDRTKSGYGHAFVLLAASTALQAGIEGAAELFAAVNAYIDEALWVESEGAIVDSLSREGIVADPGYRGQNANMHLTEAYLAAYEATRERSFLDRAERIGELIVLRHGPRQGWRIPEHFDEHWSPVHDFNIDRPRDAFRPYGSLVGHWFEWARLLLHISALLPDSAQRFVSAAVALFDAGVTEGWDSARGGLVYSVDAHGAVVNPDRMHWAVAEALGACVSLAHFTDRGAYYEEWYRRFWDYVGRFIIDSAGGGWWHQLDEHNAPSFSTWAGKPDLYHAFQATLYARADPRIGLATAANAGSIR